MTATPGLFELGDLLGDRPMPVVWSWGMGRDSTAGIARHLLEPNTRPPELEPDLSNLVVLVAQTGDEWHETIELCDTYMLPLFRENGVRLVEVARSGLLASDPLTIFQDTRSPLALHGEGDFKLSDEGRIAGVMPITMRRSCSQRSKGEVMDRWRKMEFGGLPYVHAIGFNRGEHSRIEKDPAYQLTGQRRPIYPLYDWRWGREEGGDFLRGLFGVEWPKSACRMCPFAGSVAGWPETLARFIKSPEEAVYHLVDELCALAFNENTKLFKSQSLIERLRRDGAGRVVSLAEQRMNQMPWGLYHVERIFAPPARPRRRLTMLTAGPQAEIYQELMRVAESRGTTVAYDGLIPPRVWLRRRTPGQFPHAEEFFVAAPQQAESKARKGFAKAWFKCTGESTDPVLEPGSGEEQYELVQ